MKILILSILSATVGWMLCYSAMKTAEQIAKNQIAKIEAIQ